MYDKIAAFFKDKKTLILGCGREGQSSFGLLRRMGITPDVADQNAANGAGSLSAEVKVFTGEKYLDALYGDYDVILKSPGIALLDKFPPEVTRKITCQTDLLFRFCDNPIIGVAGTKGKSTTASLIYHILRQAGKKAILNGNIGIPPLECAETLEAGAIVVCECGCHQLEYCHHSPNIAVLLNIYPEHLDHYIDFAAYQQAKYNIFRFQCKYDTLIVGANLSVPMPNSKLVSVEQGDIPNTALKIPGEHNLYNLAAAVKAVQPFGISFDDAVRYAADFEGLPHRLQVVGRYGKNNAEFVNDSISTVPETTIAALKTFPDTDTLIIGGMDRGVSFAALTDYINADNSLKNIICLPDTGHAMADAIVGKNVIKAQNLENAVTDALYVTRVRCILSPAAASYGFFRDFEERGEKFVQFMLTRVAADAPLSEGAAL